MSDLIMNEETKKKLSGLLPMTSSFTVDLTPDCYNDIEEAFKPVFTLKPLSNKEMQDISKKINTITKDEEQALQIVRTHLVGWHNVVELPSGDALSFETETDKDFISTKLWNILPRSVQASLVGSLLGISGLKSAT